MTREWAEQREAEVRARLAKATPGPWWHTTLAIGFIAKCGQDQDNAEHYVVPPNESFFYRPNGARHDAEFIAHAPSDLSDALDEIGRQKRYVADLTRTYNTLANKFDEAYPQLNAALDEVASLRSLLLEKEEEIREVESYSDTLQGEVYRLEAWRHDVCELLALGGEDRGPLMADCVPARIRELVAIEREASDEKETGDV